MKILNYLIDWQLFKKPKSTQITSSVINDILSVDATKWFHPKITDRRTVYWGTVENINGKDVYKNGDTDLYVYEHPDLSYKIADFPSATCKQGEFKNVTEKDCEVIRRVLYTSLDKTTVYINLGLISNPWYVLYVKSKHWHSLVIILLIIGLAAVFAQKL